MSPSVYCHVSVLLYSCPSSSCQCYGLHIKISIQFSSKRSILISSKNRDTALFAEVGKSDTFTEVFETQMREVSEVFSTSLRTQRHP